MKSLVNLGCIIIIIIVIIQSNFHFHQSNPFSRIKTNMSITTNKISFSFLPVFYIYFKSGMENKVNNYLKIYFEQITQ